MALSLLAGFKGYIQFKKCLIDNTTFRLHYQVLPAPDPRSPAVPTLP